MCEADNTCLLLVVSLYPTEVVQEYGEALSLLASGDHDLVELHLVELLLVEAPHVFGEACTVDEDLEVEGAHFFLADFRLGDWWLGWFV